MAVRKCRALAEMERPRHAVGRDLPRFREPRLVLLRRQVVSRPETPNRRSVMSVDDVSFAIIALNVLGIVRLAEHETPAVASDRRQLPDRAALPAAESHLCRQRLRSPCGGSRPRPSRRRRTPATRRRVTASFDVYPVRCSRGCRCAMTLGCTLPNRLLTGTLTFRIGSQTNQPCSFQMVWISFQIAFRSPRSSVVTSLSTS